jgi:hypothetical protein
VKQIDQRSLLNRGTYKLGLKSRRSACRFLGTKSAGWEKELRGKGDHERWMDSGKAQVMRVAQAPCKRKGKQGILLSGFFNGS